MTRFAMKLMMFVVIPALFTHYAVAQATKGGNKQHIIPGCTPSVTINAVAMDEKTAFSNFTVTCTPSAEDDGCAVVGIWGLGRLNAKGGYDVVYQYKAQEFLTCGESKKYSLPVDCSLVPPGKYVYICTIYTGNVDQIGVPLAGTSFIFQILK